MPILLGIIIFLAGVAVGVIGLIAFFEFIDTLP